MIDPVHAIRDGVTLGAYRVLYKLGEGGIEARAVTQITDPGIVQVFDFGLHTDGSANIVMELLEGEPLDRRLSRLGRIAPIDVLRIVRQLAPSLYAAHRKGIIHRDLKPENILLVGDPAVTGGERAKILDFGIAKLTADEPGRLETRTNLVMLETTTPRHARRKCSCPTDWV